MATKRLSKSFDGDRINISGFGCHGGFYFPFFFSMLLKGGNQLSKFGKWHKYVKITHNNV
jgi:hypothetical protein